MSRDNSRHILLAGTQGEDEFWKTMYLLDDLGPGRMAVSDRDSFFQALGKTSRPFMVLLLSACLSEKLTREDIQGIRRDYGAEIMVAGQFSTWISELQARTAGIACYILLPDEAPALAEQTRHLLNACRKRLDRQPGRLCGNSRLGLDEPFAS